MAKEEFLHDWLRRIRKVEYKDNKKKELRFTYESGEEDFPVLQSDLGRYVEVEKIGRNFTEESRIRYYLVESPPKSKDFNFENCIFLTDIIPPINNLDQETNFDQEVNFKNCIFTKQSTFYKTIFKKKVNFSGTTFLGDAYFRHTTFSGDADFIDATFSKDITFEKPTFSSKADFQRTTFSGKAIFMNTTFPEITFFCNTKFSEDAHFESTTFSGEADFRDTTFSEDANFGSVTFSKKVSFTRSTFSGEVNFGGTTFSEDVYFGSTIFSEDVHFGYTIFSRNAIFLFSKFHQEANFSGARFVKQADFGSIKVDFLNFSSVKWGEYRSNTHVLNLKSAQIGRIDYTNTKFPRVESRHTYLILKNLAIKQNDAIQALEFYRQEMGQHYRKLSWLTNPADKLILWIERIVSSYGTNPFQAILWLFVVNLFFVKSNTDLDQGLPFELIISFFTFRGYPLNGTHLAALILNPFLIYEVVKSLRKFSRKL